MFTQENHAGKTEYLHAKNKNGSVSYAIYNISSKGFKDFSIIPETVKLQEENTEGSLLDFNLGNNFLDMTQKAQATKIHIDKWDHIKLISFCRVKETINKMTRQTTEWEKILANSVSVKQLQYLRNSYNSIAK